MTNTLIPADKSVRTSLAILAAPSVSPSNCLSIVRRNRWRILAFVAASVLATFVVSEGCAPLYESTTVIDVARQSPSHAASNDFDQFLAIQMKLVTSDAVLRPVAEKYNLLELKQQIRVSRSPNTYSILIKFRSPDPQDSADVANAVAQSLLQQSSVRIADLARPAYFAVHTSVPLNLGVAFLSALLLAMAAVITADVLESSAPDSERISPGLITVVLSAGASRHDPVLLLRG